MNAKLKKSGDYFLKIDGWKKGDKVKCLSSYLSMYVVGKVYVLENSLESRRFRVENYTGEGAEFELVTQLKGFAKWIKSYE